jgi:hypothetical protein
MLKFTFKLFKPWLNSPSCINGGGGYCHLEKLRCCSEITIGSWDALDCPSCPHIPLQ